MGQGNLLGTANTGPGGHPGLGRMAGGLGIRKEGTG